MTQWVPLELLTRHEEGVIYTNIGSVAMAPKKNVSASLTTTTCPYKSSGRHETLRPPHPLTGCWQVQPHAEVRAYEFTAAVEPSRMQHLSHAQKTAFHNTPPFLQLLTFFPPAASAMFSSLRKGFHGYPMCTCFRRKIVIHSLWFQDIIFKCKERLRIIRWIQSPTFF